MSETDDISELLGRVAHGDREAFDTLYVRTSSKLFAVALRMLRDRAEAEDALQEIYVRVWQKSGSFAQSRARGMTWLISIARNHAIDRLRARKARPAAELDEAHDIRDGAPTAETREIARGERARILDCMGELEEDRAAALKAAYLEGRSYRELADRFAVPLNTMRTWLRRSLVRLRECLER